MTEKEPYYGEEEGQPPYTGEDKATGGARNRETDTATQTSEETGGTDDQATMRPTGSGGSAPPKQ